jgi:hypothetical protein
MPRRLAVTKRITLGGIGEGWTDEAYVLVIPATPADFDSIQDFDTVDHTPQEQIKFQNDFSRARILSGKVFTFDDNNNLVLDDYQPDDLEAMPDLANKIFLEINGITLDPKDIQILAAKFETEKATKERSKNSKRSKTQ